MRVFQTPVYKTLSVSVELSFDYCLDPFRGAFFGGCLSAVGGPLQG